MTLLTATGDDTEVLRSARRELARFDQRSVPRQLVALGATWTYWAVAFAAAARLPWLPARLLASVLVAVFATNLFLVGHDAGHGSFTARRRLDRAIGRTGFLPTLHPFSMWSDLHNRVHHRFTNLRGRDFVWAPLDPAEYRARSAIGRLMYRVERSTAGFGVYYAYEIWWRKLFHRRPEDRWRLRPEHRLDQALAIASLVGQVAAAQWLGGGGAIVTAVAAPWLVAMWMLGFGTYYNHTHPSVPWYASAERWSHLPAQLTGSLHLRYPPRVARFLGNVMEHPAHHLHTRVPLCRLREAQTALAERLGDLYTTEAWSLATHRRIVRTCKLFDFDAERWVGFRSL